MKKIYLLSLLFLLSCGKEKNNKQSFRIQESESHLQVIIIDSCEYLYGPWGNATVLTHKGNCKNHKK